MKTFNYYLETIKDDYKVGDKVIYKNDETVTIVKIRETETDRDLKGKKIKPYKNKLYTVEFSDGEKQVTGCEDFKKKVDK